MRNSVALIISLLASLCLFSAGVNAESKIGFVDTAKLMESAPQAKSAQSNIEAEFAPREKELLTLHKSIQKMEDRLSRDGGVMSESERSKLERKILGKRRDLKRGREEFSDDLNIRRNEVLAKLQKDMYEAVLELAKERNFDLIFSQGVVYASDRVDVTESVLKKLSKK